MVHTNPEFEKTSNLTLDWEIHQHLGSFKHVINIIMWIRDTGCYTHHQRWVAAPRSGLTVWYVSWEMRTVTYTTKGCTRDV
jgi:hypothetical protein